MNVSEKYLKVIAVDFYKWMKEREHLDAKNGFDEFWKSLGASYMAISADRIAAESKCPYNPMKTKLLCRLRKEAKRWLRHGQGIQYELIKSPIIKRELNRSMNYYILRRVAELKQKRK